MGLRFGLENPNTVFKRKHQWLFKIRGVSADDSNTGFAVNALPPRRAARPNLGWKEFEFQHLNESVFYPLKPTWEPVELMLYDICRGGITCNPVFLWIRSSTTTSFGQAGPGIYNPKTGGWTPVVDADLKREGNLYIYDGCGNVLEHWVMENCYPQHVRWGELDMDSSDVLTCECTIRYDRAYCSDK